MRRGIALLIGLVVLPAAAVSQEVNEEAMEAQRCIWRCLADADGADDPAYERCVAAKCNGEPAEAAAPMRPAKPRPGTGWRNATPNAFQANLAASSVDADFGFDLSCHRSPKGRLRVYLHFSFTVDWRIGERATLYFDGQPYDVNVDGTEDGVMLNDMVDDNGAVVSGAFMNRLRSASLVTVTGTGVGNQPRVAVFILGSGERAFGDFEAACRRIGT